MKVVCFSGTSGAGKTTLLEQVIASLCQRGLRVSVVKHAHHGFDVDHPGKDTWRHRAAGAFEVVAASDQRLALMREFEQPAQLGVHTLIAELWPGVDWVLVEGFKDSNLLKVEVWRPGSHLDSRAPGAAPQPPRYMEDDFIVAIATTHPPQLPNATLRPVFDLNQPESVAQWLVEHGERFDYSTPQPGGIR